MTSAPRIIDRLPRDAPRERQALVESLFATPASIPPKYFYDALGCALFGAICELPEYYPTRTEHAIFQRHRDAIAAKAGTGLQLVDLGAGDGRKAESLFPCLKPASYVAVDIAEAAVAPLVQRLACAHPGLGITGVLADFTAELDFLHELAPMPTLFFYPGSSIGNFAPNEAASFLRMLASYAMVAAPVTGLLIGVDTKKSRVRLDRAYDDTLGVTAAFNRNVLHHVNRVIDAEFNPACFLHRGFYVEAAGRVEMHLESRMEHRVRIGAALRTFASGERIHTESSYKYAPDEFAAMLRQAGFASVSRWLDANGDFAVFHASCA